jgi:hypothetical protein
VSEQTYLIGGADRGLWLGLGPGRVTILGAGVLAATLLAYAGAPLPIAALAAALGAAWCFASVGGVTLHEWAGPVATHLGSALTGGRRRPAELAPTLTDGRVDLGRPLALRASRELGRLVFVPVSVDDVELGVVAEKGRTGWDVTCVFSTRGLPGFAVADPDEQARLLAGWSDLLTSLTGEYAGRCRLQWVERAGPQSPDALRAWTAEHADDPASPYLELLDSAGDHAMQHETFLAVQVATGERDRDRAVREGEALHRLLAARLAVAEITPRPLDLAGMALQLQRAGDLTAEMSSFVAGVHAVQVGPASRRSAWDHLRTDDTFHRAFLVTGWPKLGVGPSWLAPLLVTAVPGAVRTVAVHFEAVPPALAARRARAARQGADLDSDDRARLGFGIGARERRTQVEAAAAEHDLAAGHVQHRVAAVVVVSAQDLASLDEASRQVRGSASSARLDLRPLHGRHADGWAAALPLCRLRHRQAV